MCCNTEPQSGVRMSSCMIYGIYTIHLQVLQSRHDASDHSEAHRKLNHLKLIRSCLLFYLSEDSLENQDAVLKSSGCLLAFYRSTLLVKLLWFLQKINTSFIIGDNDVCHSKRAHPNRPLLREQGRRSGESARLPPTFRNSNSILDARTLLNGFLWTPCCSVGKQITLLYFVFSCYKTGQFQPDTTSDNDPCLHPSLKAMLIFDNLINLTCRSRTFQTLREKLKERGGD